MCPTTPSKIVLAALASIVIQKEEIKVIHTKKNEMKLSLFSSDIIVKQNKTKLPHKFTDN